MPTSEWTAASALSAQIRASALPSSGADLGAHLAGRGQLRRPRIGSLARGVDQVAGAHRGHIGRQRRHHVGQLDAQLGELAADGAHFGPLQVGDVLLTGRAGQHRHQFPAVLSPLIEDLLGRVRQQRDGGVLPAGRFAHARLSLSGSYAALVSMQGWLPTSSDDRSAVGWPSRLTKARLHFVTGKGGTGKSTIAAALALALAAGGRKVLLVEVEGRQGIAQLFDVPPLPYEEVKIATADGGGQVNALAIDTEAAFLEYLDMFYNLGMAGRAMRRIGAVEFATTIAPGLRDVLLTGKIREIVTRG